MITLVKLNTLFRISHGNKLDLNKLEVSHPKGEDAIVFVNRSGEKNGFGSYVRAIPGIEPFNAGLITVALGGSTLASFVQSRPFYTAQNIDVLEPYAPMSLEIKLYYCLCIEANRFRYSTFGREANRTLQSLLLPAMTDIPDWTTGTLSEARKELIADIAKV